MAPPIIQTDSGSITRQGILTLSLEIQSSLHRQLGRTRPSKYGEPGGIPPSELTEALSSVGWVCSYSAAIPGLPEESQPTERPGRRLIARSRREHEPEVIRLKFGSPLVAVLAPSGQITEDLAALSFFIFFLRQVWRLDLQLRTRESQLEERYFRAREAAERAEARWKKAKERLEEEQRIGGTSSAGGEGDFDELDRLQGWGSGASRGVADRCKTAWRGRQAIWQEDDD
jgi:hypothetical protein